MTSPTFDPSRVRSDFPILSRRVGADKPLVYLDNAATSHKPEAMIDAIAEYYTQHNANVHRGVHQLGDESTQLFHQARQTVAQFLGASAEELVLVTNETLAANLVAYAFEPQLKAGEILLTTEMEHHSNIVPWQELCHRRQAKLEWVRVNDDGRLDLAHLESQLTTHQPRLFAVTHVSNTLGTLNPLPEIVALVRRLSPHTLLFVDGAQAAPHLPVEFDQLDVDFYAVSAHKMLGPMGMGAVLIKRSLLNDFPPLLFGGGMIDAVTTEGTTFAENIEDRYTAGTPDVAGVVAWAASCSYLKRFSWQDLLAHDQSLVAQTLAELTHFPQIKIIGPTASPTKPSQQQQKWGLALDRIGSVAFVYQGVHAHDVAQILASEGVAARSGHHCTMPLHQKFQLAASTRFSFQLYNTKDEITAAMAALKKIQVVFGA